MATVSCYLVVIASGLVRDVYQRFLRPAASQVELERLSYFVMILVGAIAVLANIRPVDYLQAIVVFSGTGCGATFCVPLLMLVFWRRATVPGMFASMIAGAGTMLGLPTCSAAYSDMGAIPCSARRRRFVRIICWESTRSFGAWPSRWRSRASA